jgi:CBS-domain-containing membrane protein
MDAAAKTMRVRDIMTSEVITLAATTSVDDAARSLTFHKVSGAPVVDHGRIVGVVSKSDLVEPRHRSSEGSKPTVAQAMARMVYAVRPSDPAMAAVRLMVREGVHRAVVVNDKGKLAGIVSAMDVMRALVAGGHMQEEQEQHADPAVAVDHVEYVDLRAIEPAN